MATPTELSREELERRAALGMIELDDDDLLAESTYAKPKYQVGEPDIPVEEDWGEEGVDWEWVSEPLPWYERAIEKLREYGQPLLPEYPATSEAEREQREQRSKEEFKQALRQAKIEEAQQAVGVPEQPWPLSMARPAHQFEDVVETKDPETGQSRFEAKSVFEERLESELQAGTYRLPGKGEEVVHRAEPFEPREIQPKSLEEAVERAHWGFVGLSMIDPTMLSDFADAALYEMMDDSEMAGQVLLWSAGGLGAGALAVKLMRMKKASGMRRSLQAELEGKGMSSEAARESSGEVFDLAAARWEQKMRGDLPVSSQHGRGRGRGEVVEVERTPEGGIRETPEPDIRKMVEEDPAAREEFMDFLAKEERELQARRAAKPSAKPTVEKFPIGSEARFLSDLKRLNRKSAELLAEGSDNPELFMRKWEELQVAPGAPKKSSGSFKRWGKGAGPAYLKGDADLPPVTGRTWDADDGGTFHEIEVGGESRWIDDLDLDKASMEVPSNAAGTGPWGVPGLKGELSLTGGLYRSSKLKPRPRPGIGGAPGAPAAGVVETATDTSGFKRWGKGGEPAYLKGDAELPKLTDRTWDTDDGGTFHEYIVEGESRWIDDLDLDKASMEVPSNAAGTGPHGVPGMRGGVSLMGLYRSSKLKPRPRPGIGGTSRAPWQMTRAEFEATGEELMHGTDVHFDRFLSKVARTRYGQKPSPRGPSSGRFYFTEQPDVARSMSDATRSGGHRQVDFDKWAQTQGEGWIPSNDPVWDELLEELHSDVRKDMKRKPGRVLAYIDPDGGPNLIKVKDPSEIPRMAWAEQFDIRLYEPERWPRVIKTNVYGRTLDLTDPKNVPDDLAKLLKEEGRFDPTAQGGGWQHEFSAALVKYARENNYGKIKVRDGHESGGRSTIGIEEYIGYGVDPHHAFVEKAIREGKDVPEKVLRRYPDLYALKWGTPK